MQFKRSQVLLLVLLLALVGCQKNVSTSTPGVPSTSDHTLSTIASALDGVAKGNQSLSAFVRAQNQAGTISDVDTAKILTISNKVAQAVLSASATTKVYTSLTPEQRGNVLTVVQAVLPAVNDVLANGLAGIKNQASLAEVARIMSIVQAGLSTAQVALAAATN